MAESDMRNSKNQGVGELGEQYYNTNRHTTGGLASRVDNLLIMAGQIMLK